MEISRDELEDLIDKKVEERLSEQKNEQESSLEQTQDNDHSEYSRRDFLKGAATGLGGVVGLASLAPMASAFSIRSNDGFSFMNNAGSNQLNIGPSGQMTVASLSASSISTDQLNGDISPNGVISHIGGNIYVQSSEPSNPSQNDIWIDTS